MITYPVDVENDRFTFKLGPLVLRGQRWPREDGAALADADPALVVLEEQPQQDATLGADEKLGPVVWVDDEGNQTATPTRAAVAMTAEEIAAATDNTEREAKRVTAANAVTWLRDKSAEAGAVNVTSGNAVNVLQGVVDNLELFYSRFADFLEGNRFDK